MTTRTSGRAGGRRAHLALLSLLALVSAACGSNVDRGAAQGDGLGVGAGSGSSGDQYTDNTGSDGGGGSTSGSTSGGSSTGGKRGGPVAGGSGGTGTGTGSGPGTDGGGGSTTGGPGSIARMGKGVTAEKIYIGIWLSDPAARDALAKSTGASGSGPGAPLNPAEPVIKWINENGGMSGREVVPVYHRTNGEVTTQAGRDRDAQEACATWTEDNKVFAFLPGQLTSRVYISCAQKTKTVYLDYGWQYMSEKGFRDVGNYYYVPGSISSERHARTLLESVREGFFTPSSRVAILTPEDPWIRAGTNKVLKPELESRGYHVLEIVYPDTALWSTYVEKMKNEDITHVLFAPVRTPQTALLMWQAAQNAEFYPLYAAGGEIAPGPGAEANATIPREQWKRTRYFTWKNLFASDPPSSAAKQCDKILKDAGIQNASGFREACDRLFFLKTALDRTKDLTPEGLAASVATIGDAHVSTVFFAGGASSFGPTKHDGAKMVRNLAWNNSTNWFHYVSGYYEVK